MNLNIELYKRISKTETLEKEDYRSYSPKREEERFSSNSSSRRDSDYREEKRKRSPTPERKRSSSPYNRRSPSDSYKRSPEREYKEDREDYKKSSYKSNDYKDDYQDKDYKKRERSPMKKKRVWVGPKIIPCRYFGTPRGCPKGNECTFIHEEKNSDSSNQQPQE